MTHVKGPKMAEKTGTTLMIYTGDEPLDVAGPDSGFCLAALDAHLDGEGKITCRGVAHRSGQAGHLRIKNEQGQVVCQGKITTLDGDGDMRFETLDIQAGETIEVSHQVSSGVMTLLR